MDTSPLVSVILSAYNAEKYIVQSVESILNQTYTNWELLVCDDASTDESWNLIQLFQDSRIKRFRNTKNLGYLITCNFLFEKCSGNYITFQDADDWSDTRRLEKQVTEFKRDPELGVCGTYAQYYDHSGSIGTRQKRPALKHNDISSQIGVSNQFCGASIMVRKDVLETIGGYRAYFNRIGNEDYDWASRIVERYKALNLPEYLYNVRQSKGSVSRTIRNPRQLISGDIVRQLVQLRRGGQKDWIDQGNMEELAKFENSLLKKYSYVDVYFRKVADLSYHSGDMKQYIGSCFRAYSSNIFSLINWKYLIHGLWRLFIAGMSRHLPK